MEKGKKRAQAEVAQAEAAQAGARNPRPSLGKGLVRWSPEQQPPIPSGQHRDGFASHIVRLDQFESYLLQEGTMLEEGVLTEGLRLEDGSGTLASAQLQMKNVQEGSQRQEEQSVMPSTSASQQQPVRTTIANGDRPRNGAKQIGRQCHNFQHRDIKLMAQWH